MLRLTRLALLALPLALAGCGIPDLVATGIKAAEDNPAPANPPAATAAQAPAPSPAATRPEPPPVAAPASMPERTPVSAEPLK